MNFRSTDYGTTYEKLNEKVGPKVILSYLYVSPNNKRKVGWEAGVGGWVGGVPVVLQKYLPMIMNVQLPYGGALDVSSKLYV